MYRNLFSCASTRVYSFSDSIPISIITESWVEFHELCRRSLLIIYFKCVSVYLLIPTSCFIIPLHLSPLVTSGLSSKSISMFLFCTLVQGYQFIDSNYKWYHMIWVFIFIKHDQLIVPSMVLQKGILSYFYGWVMFHFLYVQLH